jgi:hypothetical protein
VTEKGATALRDESAAPLKRLDARPFVVGGHAQVLAEALGMILGIASLALTHLYVAASSL